LKILENCVIIFIANEIKGVFKMLIVENVKVFNFEGAMRGLRNPKDSWHLSDSNFNQDECLLPENR
jgi:hypothetical protein